MTVAAGRTDAGTGHHGVVLLFTNTGTGRCRMARYPGVAALDAAGTQVQQAQRTPSGYLGGLRAGQDAPVVTLAAGESASALLEGGVVTTNGGACQPYVALLVTAPDDTRSTRVPVTFDGCVDLQIHPIVPGPDGRSA